MGITARLLSQHGISIFNENHLNLAAEKLAELERNNGQSDDLMR
jgi:hypothetical protein